MLLISLLVPAQTQAAPQVDPLVQRLTRALRAGDRSRLARLGAAAGARGLAPILGSNDRSAVLAAVTAAPAAEDAWALLVPLAERAAGPDRPVAIAAAVAATTIGERLSSDWDLVYESHDIPGDTLAQVVRAWQALSGDPGRWADVRIHALEVCAHVGAVLRKLDPAVPAPFDLATLAADPDAQVRRAAFELLPSPPAQQELAIAARAVAVDPDAAAALAAAQAICSGLGFADTPAPILAALGKDGLDRLRSLVVDRTLAPAARVDGGRCLAAEGSAESRRAVRALQSSLPSRIRRQVRRLVPSRRR